MVNSLKDLKKLIHLCRAQGVETIKVHGIEFTLGAEPEKQTKATAPVKHYASIAPGGITAETTIETEELTEEQLLFYSAVDQSQEQQQN